MTNPFVQIDSAGTSSDSGSDLGPSSEPDYPGFEVDLDIVDASLGNVDVMLPLLTKIICAVLRQQKVDYTVVAEVFVRIVGNDDSQTLNSDFRGKHYPTNVLSFPGCAPDDIATTIAASAAGGPPVMLGDIVIAASVVEAEAVQQDKATMDHFCHLVVHGLLHLLGYDHIEDKQAETMEAIEIVILSELGIENPYFLEQGHG